MLGFDSPGSALMARPAAMVSVAPETWDQLESAFAGGAFEPEFSSAWANGAAFLSARDGLRHRRPVVVEWKGSHRAPGDEVAPVDLRVDHVFLVSCKYLSKILVNASPFRLFERLLQGAHGGRERDWYLHSAPAEYQALYGAVRGALGMHALPAAVGDLSAEERKALAGATRSGWPPSAAGELDAFVRAVARGSASSWRAALDGAPAREAMLWRLLRMGSAPYFVLGTSSVGPLRVRVATPWDWRQRYRLRAFDVEAQPGGQPRVGWTALVEERNSALVHPVQGHVEIRWAHGRFAGNPEAKAYLDTPHREVPGYFALL